MKLFAYILLVAIAALAGTACEPARQGGYEAAPAKGNESESFEQDVVVKIDSSVEKALKHDTNK